MSEELEQAVALIQEAKGLADGPNGGNVTDHLDFAESWIDKAADRIEALTAENKRLRELLDAWLGLAREHLDTELAGRTFEALERTRK